MNKHKNKEKLDIIPTNLSINLAELREYQLKMNQTKLGNILKVGQANISAIEKSKIKSLDEDKLIKLVELCKQKLNKTLNLNWLFLNIGDMFLPQTDEPLTLENFRDKLLEYQKELSPYELAKKMDIKESRLEKLATGKAEPITEELKRLKALMKGKPELTPEVAEALEKFARENLM